jgi:hypothetical protein
MAAANRGIGKERKMARPNPDIDVDNSKFRGHGTGAIPDAPDARDYDYRAVAAASRFVKLPESVSLAEWFPKHIWNQDPFGSCTSYSANHLVTYVREVLGLPYIEPSFMATWYWTKLAMYGPEVAAKDVGCSIREAVLSTRREGVAPANLFPYGPQYLGKIPDEGVKAEAEKHQSLYFFRLDDYWNGIELDFLYRCLAEGWPVSIAIPLYDTFEPDYNNGYVPYPAEGDQLEGYHAMTLYGYYMKGRRPYFRCRNQWGSNWGGRHILPSGKHIEPGTCRLPVEYVRDMGFDFWTVRAVEDGKVQGVRLDEVIK